MDADVTKQLLREGWYRRCADEPNLTDHQGARNAIASLLDYIASVEADLKAVVPVVRAARDHDFQAEEYEYRMAMRLDVPKKGMERTVWAHEQMHQALASLPPELLERLSAMEDA